MKIDGSDDPHGATGGVPLDVEHIDPQDGGRAGLHVPGRYILAADRSATHREVSGREDEWASESKNLRAAARSASSSGRAYHARRAREVKDVDPRSSGASALSG